VDATWQQPTHRAPDKSFLTRPRAPTWGLRGICWWTRKDGRGCGMCSTSWLLQAGKRHQARRASLPNRYTRERSYSRLRGSSRIEGTTCILTQLSGGYCSCQRTTLMYSSLARIVSAEAVPTRVSPLSVPTTSAANATVLHTNAVVAIIVSNNTQRISAP
jgi:hypothetical protein